MPGEAAVETIKQAKGLLEGIDWRAVVISVLIAVIVTRIMK